MVARGAIGRCTAAVGWLCCALVLGALAATALPPPVPAGAKPPSAPGVTPTSITTGYIGTLTGPLAADNAGFLPGVRAYFDTVNAHGGINGRKLDLAYSLDDQGNPSRFISLARTLVDQDGVFAVTGISTDFFSPNVFAESHTPTYGYNTTGGWAKADNLFASNGAVQCYSCTVPAISYVVKAVHAKSVALVAYNVSASSALCATVAKEFESAGIHVSYEDLHAPIDGNMTPDVERMQRAGSDFVLSCMDVTGNISMARAIKQYGLHITQLWLNGSDRSVIKANSALMQGTYFLLQNVPLRAPTRYYPGLAAYLAAMRRYEPKYVGADLAVQGWESAALFAAGVRAAGKDLTRQRVIAATNEMRAFTAGGLAAVTDWKVAHTTSTFPNCVAFAKVKAKRLVPVFGHGHQVFVCFDHNAVRHPTPVKAPPGTPGT